MKQFLTITGATLLSLCLIFGESLATNSYYNHTNPFTPGTTVRSSDMNAKFDGIEDGFEKFPAPYGGAPTTKGFSEPFIIDDGTNRNHPISIGQFQDIDNIIYNVAVGTNTYTLDLTPDLPAYSEGQVFWIMPQNENTTAVTINIDGLGAKSILNANSDALSAGQLLTTGIYPIVYDGTSFVLAGAAFDQTLNTGDDVIFASVQTELTMTTARDIAGVPFNGTANVHVGVDDNATGEVVDLTDTVVDFQGVKLELDEATFANQDGIITKSGSRWLHDFSYGNNGTATPDGFNVFLGEEAGNYTIGSTATISTHGSNNVGIGHWSLYDLTSGYRNVGVGSRALQNLTEGVDNVAIGDGALSTTTIDDANVAIGADALRDLAATSIYGSNNVAVGDGAGNYLVTPYRNVLLGAGAGGASSYTVMDTSVMIGYHAYPSASGNENEIVIGYTATGNGDNTVTLGNGFITGTYIRGKQYLGNIDSDVCTQAGSWWWDSVDARFEFCSAGSGVPDTFGAGSIEVQDEAFTAGNWDSDTAHGASQDDVYDRFHLYDADDDGDFTDETWFSASGFDEAGSYSPTGTWNWSGVNGASTWPTFNQNTTGSAATLTTARTIADVSFNGSANVHVGVDDNATGARMTIGNSAIAFGVDGAPGSMFHLQNIVDDQIISIWGGTGAEDAVISLHASAEINNPSNMYFGGGGSTWSMWDEADGIYTLTGGSHGSRTNALRTYTGGIVSLPATYANDMTGETYRPLLINNSGELGYDSSPSTILTWDANTDPQSTDILWIVDNPGGTPNDESITLANVGKGITRKDSFRIALEDPADADSFLVDKAGQAMTVTRIDCIVDPADSSESVVITFQECDSSGDTCTTTIESVTCTNGGANSTTIDDASIASGNWINFDVGTVTGTVSELTVKLYYTEFVNH